MTNVSFIRESLIVIFLTKTLMDFENRFYLLPKAKLFKRLPKDNEREQDEHHAKNKSITMHVTVDNLSAV